MDRQAMMEQLPLSMMKLFQRAHKTVIGLQLHWIAKTMFTLHGKTIMMNLVVFTTNLKFTTQWYNRTWPQEALSHYLMILY